jgi:cytochrome b6-f complex iron-sulfur subunit
MTSTRRELLRTGWKIGGAALLVAAGWTAFESLRPLGASSKGAVLDLGDPANYPPDSATYVTEGRLFVANASGHLFALSQKCPHLGCRVPFCDSSGRFECPCHGSKFDLGGEWIEGPAPRGMDQYELTLENGTLVVDTSKLTAGPDRGADQFLTPPKGPSCH